MKLIPLALCAITISGCREMPADTVNVPDDPNYEMIADTPFQYVFKTIDTEDSVICYTVWSKASGSSSISCMTYYQGKLQ